MSATRLKSLNKFPAELKDVFRQAVEHYGYGSFSAFFQASALTLVEHYRQGDKLLAPLSFQHSNQSNGTLPRV